MKRTSLRSVSRKRAKENRVRASVVADMAENGYVACVRCGGPATDAHELLSRARGGSIIDPANIVPLCRRDHQWVTEHPREAEAAGLSRSQHGPTEPCTHEPQEIYDGLCPHFGKPGWNGLSRSQYQ